MLFDKEFLLYGITRDNEVYTKITGQRRWVTEYEKVFRHEGKFYITHYEEGSTECQDQGPYEYEPDQIECQEVFPHEVTITVYKTEPARVTQTS